MRKKESGLLSLEASIVVVIFLFLMLYLYSFFIVFEARNAIGHSMLAAVDSVAFDAYAPDKVVDGEGLSTVYGLVYGAVEDLNLFDHQGFTNWETGEIDAPAVVKERFLAYLSGSGKNTGEAEQTLNRLHIVGGVSGLDFSKSHVSDDKLYVTVEYSLDYTFQVFGLKGVKMRQSCCSKIWK